MTETSPLLSQEAQVKRHILQLLCDTTTSLDESRIGIKKEITSRFTHYDCSALVDALTLNMILFNTSLLKMRHVFIFFTSSAFDDHNILRNRYIMAEDKCCIHLGEFLLEMKSFENQLGTKRPISFVGLLPRFTV